MNYIRKICPICREEFCVMSTVEEKDVYCTLKCLIESVDRLNERMDERMDEINFIEPF